MIDTKEQQSVKLHGIQLKSVDVVELFIRANQTSDESTEKKSDFSIKSSHSEYDEEEKTVQVGIQLEYGMEKDSETPCSMKIELFGDFEVDEDLFDKNHIADWAKRNAPMILFPYLREQAYALSVRCGLPPFILPLIQMPTLKHTD